MLIELIDRVSHQLWRRIVKRERRRRGRRRDAQERDHKYQEEQAAFLEDPTFVAELERLELLEEEAQRMEEQEAARMKEEWQLRDAALHSKFIREKQKRFLQQEQQETQEALIKKEWEDKQKKEKEEEEKRKEEQVWLEKPVKPSNQLLGHIHPNRLPCYKLQQGVLEREGEEVHNPEPPPGFTRKDYTRQKGEPCPFFSKTGACRFGIQCSREHEYPESSRTILLPNMYSHFGMEQLSFEGNDADIALEYTDSETYEHFREFFDDTLPEFQRCGNVIQFKVCCNTSSHLRGNVYVQYSKEEDALEARSFFNGRWYAGRQLTCLFVTIERWKSALCGLFWRQRCPKGGQCNFLHAYRNPGNAFWRSDQDAQSHEYSNNSQTPKHSHRTHSERSMKSRRRRPVRSPHRSRSTSEIGSSGSDNTPRRHSPKPRNRSKRSRSRSKRSRSTSKRSRSRSKRSRSRSKRSRSRSKRSRSTSKRSSRTKRSRSRSERSRSKSKRLKCSSERSLSRSDRSTNISNKPSTKSERTKSSSERTAGQLEKSGSQLTTLITISKSTSKSDE